LAVLCALLLGLIMGGGALYYWSGPGLTWGTPRAWYFVILSALLAVAIICAPWPRITMVVLSLAAVEIGFGLGSAALQRRHMFEGDLLPLNDVPHVEREWHPLLQAVREPIGLRSPDRLRATTVVAVFGGSTTEDIASADGDKWSQRLEAILGADRFSVVNHGSAGFSTTQMVLQTAFYESSLGVQPTCAVYYIGGIDIENSHMPDLDSAYANYQVPSLVDELQVRRLNPGFLSVSPTLHYLVRLVVYAFDTVRPARLSPWGLTDEPDPVLESMFVRNVRTISAINRERGIRSIWIGEVAAPAAEDIEERDLMLKGLLLHLDETLRREAAALGDAYIHVPWSAFTADDFERGGHFVAKGSLKFATMIAPEIQVSCR
jgi:lysophospholipase L1-like esterase